jgi:hypothetical protein
MHHVSLGDLIVILGRREKHSSDAHPTQDTTPHSEHDADPFTRALGNKPASPLCHSE